MASLRDYAIARPNRISQVRDWAIASLL